MFSPLEKKSHITKNIFIKGLQLSALSFGWLSALSTDLFAMAPPPAGTGGEAQGMGGLLQFMPLILIFVVFYFLLIRPQSKKAKDHKQMLEELKKGDKVITTGGIHGFIEGIDDDTVTLKIGIKDDLKIKVGRAYIAGLRTGE